jgi:hypothetical protein
MVLDDGHNFKRASDGGDLSPISHVSVQHFHGTSGPQSRPVAVAASPQAHQLLPF